VRDTAGERSREARRCYSAHDAGLLPQSKTSQLTARGASAYGCGGVSLSAARTSPCRVRRWRGYSPPRAGCPFTGKAS